MNSPAQQQPAPQARPAGQIVVERHARTFEFVQRRQKTSAHVALVLLTVKGTYHVVRPEDQPTLGELLWKRVRTIYEVDVGQHQGGFQADLPCEGDAFSFHADIDLQWEVIDPLQVVRRHIVTEEKLMHALRPLVLARMRAISRGFSVMDSAPAEEAVNEEFAASPLGAGLGLRARPFVRLSLEEATRKHASEMIGVTRQTELEEQIQQLRLLQEDNNRKLLKDRLSMYRDAIAAGDIEQFALRIAQHPNDIHAVMDAVREERDVGRRHAIEFFSKLAESNLIERYEISDIQQATIEWLNEALGALIPTSDPASLSNGRRRSPHQRDLPPPPLPGGADLPSDGGGPDGRDGSADSAEPGS